MTTPVVSHYPGHPAPFGVPLHVFPAHDCSYLPDRQSITRGFMTERMPGEVYHRFMDAGFRRSGRLFYQPVCRGCRECVALRVPVETFRPSKSQRRCARRNADLTLAWGDAVATEEKYDLYRRYLTGWHGKSEQDEAEEGWDTFASFLYDSPVDTVECTYRDAGGKLLAVGICDVCPASSSLSTVYFYHDPVEHRRGLGTFGALREIEAARVWKISHYYLGFWVAGCASMQYKSSFRPCEILHADGTWRTLADIDV